VTDREVQDAADRRCFELDAARWAAFINVLDAPPRDLPRLRQLFAELTPFDPPAVGGVCLPEAHVVRGPPRDHPLCRQAFGAGDNLHRLARLHALGKMGAAAVRCAARPRRTHPEYALSYANLQVLCGLCNRGKGNRDRTDWRFRPSDVTASSPDATVAPCELCRAPMRLREGQRGRFWGCARYPQCRATKPLSRESAETHHANR
jgi:hypothetical protein